MSAPAQERTGRPQQRDYEAETFLKKLEPVVARLNESHPTAALDRKAVASVIYQMRLFEDEVLSKKAQGVKPFRRLPARFTRDFVVGGALHKLLNALLEFREAKGLPQLSFSSSNRDEGLAALEHVHSALKAAGLLKLKVAYGDEVPFSERERLTLLAKKLGGDVSTSTSDPDVTHILRGSLLKPAEEFHCTVAMDGGKRLVHWLGLPDSHDSWLPETTFVGEDPVPLEPRRPGPWEVQARWLVESAEHNELLNELDFSPVADESGRPSKRKRMAVEDPSYIQSLFSPKPADELLAPGGVPIAPGAVKRTVLTPHPDLAAAAAADGGATGRHDAAVAGGQIIAENISRGQLQPGAPPPVTEAPRLEGADALASTAAPASTAATPAAAPAAPARLRPEMHRIPGHSSWFRINGVAELERMHNPDFFTNIPVGQSKIRGQVAYVAIRNAIVTRFREDPTRHLTLTEARKGIAFDFSLIKRVFDFLERWGVINHGTGNTHPPLHIPFLVVPDGPPGGVRVGALGLQRPSDRVFAFPPVQGGVPPKQQPALATAKPRDTPLEYFCNHCGVDITGRPRYHCTKLPDYDLCQQHFADGAFPGGTTAADFLRMESVNEVDMSGKWTDNETLLLLEALELHGDNWQEVADHVTTKTKAQCLAHFLQLPIEERFLDELDGRGQPGAEGAPEPAAGLPTAALPFADASNPILAQVAFLSAICGPRVAAAAAQAALDALCAEIPVVEADAKEVMALVAAKRPGAEANGAAPMEGVEGADAAAAAQAEKRAALDKAESSFALTQPSPAVVRASAATALAAAAVKAKQLASEEEREIQRLVLQVVEQQQLKLDAKIKFLDDMDELLMKESEQLETGRQALISDRVSLKTQQAQVLTQQQQLQARQQQLQQQEQQQRQQQQVLQQQEQQQRQTQQQLLQQQQVLTQHYQVAAQQQKQQQQQQVAAAGMASQQQQQQQQQAPQQQPAAAAIAAAVPQQQPAGVADHQAPLPQQQQPPQQQQQ